MTYPFFMKLDTLVYHYDLSDAKRLGSYPQGQGHSAGWNPQKYNGVGVKNENLPE